MKPKHDQKLKELKEADGESESHWVRKAIERLPNKKRKKTASR